MKYFFGILFLSTAALTALGPEAAAAQQELTLRSDEFRIIRLSDEPATVVVGNPSIADVTLEGKSLFLHPRGFGVTNVIVLDAAGESLGVYVVHVIFEDGYGVALYGPQGRQSFSCRKDCEPVMRIGDAPGFSATYRAQAQDKNTLAASQALGEELLVPSRELSPVAPAPSY